LPGERRESLSSRHCPHSGREAAPGACHTPLLPPLACGAREAIEAAAGSRSNPGTDGRRNRGRLARTDPCSRLRSGRPRCGPAGAARTPFYRGQDDRQAGVSRRRRARCAATSHVDDAGAVPGRLLGGHPVRYVSRCRGRQDCSYDSPPGGSTCRCRDLEQRCPLLSAATAAHRGCAGRQQAFVQLVDCWSGKRLNRRSSHCTYPPRRKAPGLVSPTQLLSGGAEEGTSSHWYDFGPMQRVSVLVMTATCISAGVGRSSRSLAGSAVLLASRLPRPGPPRQGRAATRSLREP
jgi:hypothetical protein